MAAVGKPELKYAAATSLCDQVRQRTLTRLLLALLSGAMLSLPWVDGGLYWSGWIGWVPLLFALHASSLHCQQKYRRCHRVFCARQIAACGEKKKRPTPKQEPWPGTRRLGRAAL